MGIPIWDVIKEQDHKVPYAKLAEDHFKAHGRPLRIAVDEADWSHNNLSQQHVDMIRVNEPAYNGIEKAIFYRICRLLTRNIQLLFVFDGPGRPAKRGRNGGTRIDYERLRLLKEMLRYFSIPYHEAPGEAEAECARLQQLGVVDAVFSQDSDSLMFGCDYLIRDDRVAKKNTADINNRSKENTRKNNTTARVVRGKDIREAHNLDKDGLVLFAMLAGGDYNTKGLEKCGVNYAPRAVKAGLGTSLCRCRTKSDCVSWREELVEWLRKQRINIDVPFNYPDIKILNKYRQPKISSDDQLLDLRGLRYGGWTKPIDELKLLELTSSRFNIWGKSYMNWVGPVLLVKHLVARDPSLPQQDDHQIRLKRRMKKDAGPPPLERAITFSPFGLTSLQRQDFEDDRASYWTSRVGEPFDLDHRVEREIPVYLLQRVLSPNVLDPPPEQKTPRKRKVPESHDSHDMTSFTDKKRRTTVKTLGNATPTSSVSKLSTRTPASQNRPPKSSPTCVISLIDSDDEVSTLKRLPAPRRASVADLGSGSDENSDEELDDVISRAFQMRYQAFASQGTSSNATTTASKNGVSPSEISRAFRPPHNARLVREDAQVTPKTTAKAVIDLTDD